MCSPHGLSVLCMRPNEVWPEPVLSKNSADRHFESTSDSQIDLRSGAMVEAQHPAEALGAFDGARCRFGAAGRIDQPIIDPLVIPLPMVEP